MLVLLFACAVQNSCADYVEAASACTERAGGDPATYDEATVCGEWSPEAEDAYGPWYACQAEAWRASACKTTDDLQSASSEAQECTAAG